MENTMVVTTQSEVQMNQPAKSGAVPDISLDPMDFQKEIQKIAAEQGMKIESGNVVPVEAVKTENPPEAVKPEAQPIEAAPVTVPVPPKFQTQDGNVDLPKVEKATVNAQEALARYLAMEKELRQKQNEVNKLKEQQPTIQPTYPQTYPQANQPQLTPDAINQAIAKNGAGPVLLELQQLTFNAATQQARDFYESQLSELRSRLDAKERTSELQAIANTDPWVYSEEGIKTLGAVRQNKPWLNNAPEPWLEAYKSYKAEQMLRPTPSVATVTPTAPQRAPATPVGAGNRSTPTMPSLATLSNNPSMMNEMLNKMTPDQQAQFFEQAFKAGGLK